MKVAIYIRVSPDNQRLDYYKQRKQLIDFIGTSDWEIHDLYVDDGFYGNDLNRPNLQRLLHDMEQRKFDLVLVHSLDHLNQSISTLAYLLKMFEMYKIKFKSATEIFETTSMAGFFFPFVKAMVGWMHEDTLKRKDPEILNYTWKTDSEQQLNSDAIIREAGKQPYSTGKGYNVAVYIRVSTDMQVEDGFSIEGQRSRLASFVESQDWGIYDFYVDDGYSAKDLKRPDMQRMLQDMEQKKFDVVLVYKLDRLTRSVGDLHSLLKTFDLYGVKFKSATEIFETTTAMGRFFITLVGAMAEWERGTISERVRFGIEQMVSEGKRPGGIKPYGYTRDEILIPEEAALIREVRELYMSGLGCKTVAVQMNRAGKLRRGKEWTDATVEYTLENPYYAGIIRIASKTAAGTYVNSNKDERVKCIYGKGSHEAIFTENEYEEVKAFMKRRTNGGYSQIGTYWFSGVLRCGRCGAAMFGRLTTKRTTTKGIVRTQYYICSNRHHSNSCDLPVFRQIHVEKLVFEYIEQLQIDMDKLTEETKKIVADEGKRKNEIESAKRELAKILERREKWQYMFVEGLISKQEIREKMAEEDENEREVRQRLSQEQKSLSGLPRLTELAGLAEGWPYFNDQEKKDLVYTLFNEISINTPLSKVKGVKNKFFEAYIQDISLN